MQTSQHKPLLNHLGILYEMEHRLAERLGEVSVLARNRMVREALQARLESLRGNIAQLQEAFSSLGSRPYRKTPDKRVEMLFRALDQQIKAHRNDADFDDTVLHTLGRISQIQVRNYAQTTVLALETHLPILAAGLQDMLDDYSRFTRRLSQDMITDRGSMRGKARNQSEAPTGPATLGAVA